MSDRVPTKVEASVAEATTSESSTSQTADLATGIIVVIAIAAFIFCVIIGLVCCCVRRRKTKRRRAALLASAQAKTENARLSQQKLFPGYALQENGVYPPQTQNAHIVEMPTPSASSLAEMDGQARYEILTAPPRASELYAPPPRLEAFTRRPLSNELDGNYGSLPVGTDSDVTSPMLRKEHHGP